MKFKQAVIAALVAVFLCLGGCSAIETIADYTSDNPVLASTATRLAVGRYIAAGATIEEENQRAAEVVKRVNKALTYLDGAPASPPGALLEVLKKSVAWDELTPADRLLVLDVMALVQYEIEKNAASDPVLTAETRLTLRDLLATAARAAKFYLAD